MKDVKTWISLCLVTLRACPVSGHVAGKQRCSCAPLQLASLGGALQQLCHFGRRDLDATTGL